VAEEENGNEYTTSLASSDGEKLSDSTPPPPSSPRSTEEAQDEVNRMFTDKLAKKLSGGQQAKTSVVGRALHQAISRSLSGSLRGDVEQMSVLRKQLSVEKEGSGEEKSQVEAEGKRRVLLVEDTEINRVRPCLGVRVNRVKFGCLYFVLDRVKLVDMRDKDGEKCGIEERFSCYVWHCVQVRRFERMGGSAGRKNGILKQGLLLDARVHEMGASAFLLSWGVYAADFERGVRLQVVLQVCQRS
jgi:hypothetical protein